MSQRADGQCKCTFGHTPLKTTAELCEEKLNDIKEHPECHRHDFDALAQCSMVNGALDIVLVDAHARYARVGTNGGRACDVTSGHCSCGASH